MTEFMNEDSQYRTEVFNHDIESKKFIIGEEMPMPEVNKTRYQFTRETQYGEIEEGEVRYPVPSDTEAIIDIGYRTYRGWVRIKKELGGSGLLLETYAHHGNYPDIEIESPFYPAKNGLENWLEVYKRGEAVVRLCYEIDKTLHDEIELPGYYGRRDPLSHSKLKYSFRTSYKDYTILVGHNLEWAVKYDEDIPKRYNITIVHPCGEAVERFYNVSRKNSQSFNEFVRPAIEYIDRYLAV